MEIVLILFQNLHKNIGNNINGSCTYVVLGSLLSYYDIFKDHYAY